MRAVERAGYEATNAAHISCYLIMYLHLSLSLHLGLFRWDFEWSQESSQLSADDQGCCIQESDKVRTSLIPRPPFAAFFPFVAAKKAARAGLGTRLG